MKVVQLLENHRILLKSIFLGVFIVSGNLTFMSRLIDIGLQVGVLVFLLVWVLALAAIILLAFQPTSIVKILLSLLLVISSMLSAGFHMVTSQYMGFYEFDNLLHVAAIADDAIKTFNQALWTLVIGASGLLGMFWPSGFQPSRSLLKSLAPSIAVCTVIIGILYLRQGEGVNGMPTQYSTLSYSLIVASEKAMTNAPAKPPEVQIDISADGFAGDIIFIMDESIRGDYLDINSPGGIETGLLGSAPAFHNFGVASSMTNCSHSNNVSMRYGVSRDSFLDDLLQNPSVWKYALGAGYTTTFIDAQNTQGRLDNHMTDEELNDVTYFHQIADEKHALHEKDVRVAAILVELLNNDQRDFIYVNKMGVHFPFEGKYPEADRVYQPTMGQSDFQKSYPEEGEVLWPTSGDAYTRLQFVNSYKNAVGWNLRSFFSTLFEKPPTQPYLVLYTADHGQTFHDDGRPGYGTHCSIEHTDPEEGRVPLLFFTNHDSVNHKLAAAQRLNYNKVSQFNLPATLYHLMGYSLDDLSQYEVSIFSALDQKDQRFLSKYFVRFAESPIWNSIH